MPIQTENGDAVFKGRGDITAQDARFVQCGGHGGVPSGVEGSLTNVGERSIFSADTPPEG